MQCVVRAKRASPPQELEFTGPVGPEILVIQIKGIVSDHIQILFKLLKNCLRYIFENPIILVFIFIVSQPFLKTIVSNFLIGYAYSRFHLQSKAVSQNSQEKIKIVERCFFVGLNG